MARSVIIPEREIENSKQAEKRILDRVRGGGYTYHIESYGCQMNDQDSEKLAAMLENCGYRRTNDKQEMDLILFNTCCVREHSEKRVFGNIGALKKIKEERPNLIIVVCGCMTQQSGMADKLYRRFPFVDILFGTNELYRFPQMLEEALKNNRVMEVSEGADIIAEGLPSLRTGDFSTNVTIMYGCDNFCSYCIVPYVRGRERSRSPEHILEEVQSLAQAGYKEITLLGQNVNSYRYGEDMDFPALLSAVNEVDGIKRIRFMTSHPKDLSPELIGAMATLGKVCPHIHLPVQSGSDRILTRMNRKYTRQRYMGLVSSLRMAVVDLEITTDIIVGFPGETEADFLDTLDLVEKVGFSAAYTFKYSRRSGTKAAEMEDQILQTVKEERLHRLNERIAELLKAQNLSYVGRNGSVLVEGCDRKKTSMAYGKLPGFKMVYFPGDETLIGRICDVRITHTRNNSLMGERING